MTRDAADPAPGPRRVWLARYLSRAWRGEARFLPILYTFGVFGMLLLFVQQELLPRILDSVALELASLALLGAYFFWGGLLMWRCAANVSGWRGTFAAPFTSLAFMGAGFVFFATAIWVCMGLLGLPVGWPL